MQLFENLFGQKKRRVWSISRQHSSMNDDSPTAQRYWDLCNLMWSESTRISKLEIILFRPTHNLQTSQSQLTLQTPQRVFTNESLTAGCVWNCVFVQCCKNWSHLGLVNLKMRLGKTWLRPLRRLTAANCTQYVLFVRSDHHIVLFNGCWTLGLVAFLHLFLETESCLTCPEAFHLHVWYLANMVIVLHQLTFTVLIVDDALSFPCEIPDVYGQTSHPMWREEAFSRLHMLSDHHVIL